MIKNNQKKGIKVEKHIKNYEIFNNIGEKE